MSHHSNNENDCQQDFSPLKNICEFLNAFHVYADDRNRIVEANHYCHQINEDYRQCLIYSRDKNLLIGVEYMISPGLYSKLPDEEKLYWHSHKYEVKSGLLILPKPKAIPDNKWNESETKALSEIVNWYGKTYHFIQPDLNQELPLGPPKLMMSFINDSQIPKSYIDDRDQRYNVSTNQKRDLRKNVKSDVNDDNDKAFWNGNGQTLEFKQINLN